LTAHFNRKRVSSKRSTANCGGPRGRRCGERALSLFQLRDRRGEIIKSVVKCGVTVTPVKPVSAGARRKIVSYRRMTHAWKATNTMSILDWFRRKPSAASSGEFYDPSQQEALKGKRLTEVLLEMAKHGNLLSIQAGCVFWLQQNVREAPGARDLTTMHLMGRSLKEHGPKKAHDRLVGVLMILEEMRAAHEAISNSIGDDPTPGRTGDKAQAVCMMHAAGIWRHTILSRVTFYGKPDIPESLAQIWTILLQFRPDDLMRWENLVNGQFGPPRTEAPRFEDWEAMREVTGLT